MINEPSYLAQSPYSDPGPYADRLAELPESPAEIAAAVRNVLVHYLAGGITFQGDRLAEIDHRWVVRMLAADQRRFPQPLTEPRPAAERVVGCCRDFTLLTVAALRQHGIRARSRIGFADYFTTDDYHCDHVIVEYWDGSRSVFLDAQLDPAGDWSFNPEDMPHPAQPDAPLRSAAAVWTAIRAGEIDAERYGATPGPPLCGGWFVRNYVLQELAHRQREELLLWDTWGAMSLELDGDLGLIDEVAALLLAADAGDATAEQRLADQYATNARLRPSGRVVCYSPATAAPYPVELAADGEGAPVTR